MFSVHNELCTTTNLIVNVAIRLWSQCMDNRKQFKESFISLGYLPHFLKLLDWLCIFHECDFWPFQKAIFQLMSYFRWNENATLQLVEWSWINIVRGRNFVDRNGFLWLFVGHVIHETIWMCLCIPIPKSISVDEKRNGKTESTSEHVTLFSSFCVFMLFIRCFFSVAKNN